MKKIIFISIGVLLVIIGTLNTIAYNTSKGINNQTNTPTITSTQSTQTVQPTNTPAPKYEYKILSQKDNKTVENISVLVSAGEINGEAIAMEVKKTCQKKCNIDIYDEQKAYDLQMAYDQMMGNIDTPQSNLTSWKVKNYVYVGDHYIGTVDFETGTYSTYPFRDWYYKELKAKKYNLL